MVVRSVRVTGQATRTRRVRGLFWPLVLLAGSFLQQPGRITFDSRLDLAVAPAALLQRTLSFWDSSNGVGGVGNQGVGYLFPTGPFFALGDLLGLPAWVTQRVWTALLLIVAYEGLRRLCLAVLGGQHRGAAVLAGLAWALSPRMMTELGPLSTETLPMVLLPWMLLPLMAHLPAGRVLRGSLGSSVAVLLMGGTNAAATLAVLPAAALWILTRPWPAPRRARALALWSAAVVAVSLWWIVPLVLLSGVGPPFLDWIETAATTTSDIGALAALRGVDQWIAYAPGAFWPGATLLAGQPLLVVTTTCLAALGLAGLVQRRMPERRWLVLLGALGLVALTLAHRGPGLISSPFSSLTAGLLDGPLAPLRNIHKADPLLRLPLVLGAAHLVARGLVLARTRPEPGPRRAVARAGRALPALLALLILAGAAPLLTGQLRPGPAFPELPQAWQEAADALAAADRGEGGQTPGRTLLVPASGFGRYSWGRSVDEPLQPLSAGRWATRSQVPLVTAGSTRLLDAVEEVLATGQGSPALADLLARSGFARVLVRNDLDLDVTGAVRPALVRQALERSPGLSLQRGFGPTTAPDPSLLGDGLVVRQLELWAVAGAVRQTAAVPLDDVVRLSGGPEDLLPALEAGLLRRGDPVVLSGEPDDPLPDDLPLVVTDGLQRRERAFGAVRGALGPVLAADAPPNLKQPVLDLLPFPAAGHQSTSDLVGAETVRSSSSQARPGSGLLARQAYAAVDGDLSTWWQSDPGLGPLGQWLELGLSAPVPALSVRLSLVVAPFTVGAPVTHVRLTTDRGSRVLPVEVTEQPQVLPLPGADAGPVSRVRVTVEGAQSATGAVGIRELAVPGVDVSRTLVVPPDVSRTPRAWSFAAVDPPLGPCVLLSGVRRCAPSLTRPSSQEQLDRTFTVPSPVAVQVVGTVVGRPGPATDRLLTPLDARVAATGDQLPGTLLSGPQAAVDGDPRTVWVADPADRDPALTVRLRDRATLTGLDLSWPELPVGSRPESVLLVSPEGTRLVRLDQGGARFPALTTDEVTLSFPSRTEVERRGVNGLPERLPLLVGEVNLRGAPAGARVAEETRSGVPCGFGPPVLVDGRRYPSVVSGTVGELRRGEPLALTLCRPDGRPGTVRLGAGVRRVQVLTTDQFAPRSLQLVADAQAARVPDRPTAVTVRTEGRRTVEVAPGPAALLVVPESESAGWTARLSGETLPAVAVDGWQQGYLVPAGAGGRVELVFGPDRLYRLSLVVGGWLALLVTLAVVLDRVRVRDLGGVARAEPREPLSRSSTGQRPLSRPGTLAVAAVAAGLLLGPLCGVALLVAGAVVRRPAVGGAVAGLLLTGACWPVLNRGFVTVADAQVGTVAQTLALLAVGVGAGTVLRLGPGRPDSAAGPGSPDSPDSPASSDRVQAFP